MITKIWVDIAITHLHFGVAGPFQLLKKYWEKGSWEKAAKSSTKHQPKRGGLQRPDRAVTPGATTTIPWDRAQPQVTYSLDTMSILSITTLAMRNN
jgi:hypothetical protein